jgi:hypothetical protein
MQNENIVSGVWSFCGDFVLYRQYIARGLNHTISKVVDNRCLKTELYFIFFIYFILKKSYVHVVL